ncbi:MAG: GntR family transcriptional regulator, partial [Acidovorax sp.]
MSTIISTLRRATCYRILIQSVLKCWEIFCDDQVKNAMNAKTPDSLTMGGDKSSADASVPGANMRSLIESAFHRLRADIVEGRLAAGARLAIEDLKSRYGVSGGTLREA